mmetsp:Transcript_27346/g.78768  ORF Transcript_27346/g.78768 Transcript_27346/m.78768 type:complete len:233 (-) Transcript_27346:289-987(-)
MMTCMPGMSIWPVWADCGAGTESIGPDILMGFGDGGMPAHMPEENPEGVDGMGVIGLAAVSAARNAASSSKHLRNMSCGIDCTVRSSCGTQSKCTKVFRTCKPSLAPPSSLGKPWFGEVCGGIIGMADTFLLAPMSTGHFGVLSLIGERSNMPPPINEHDDKDTFEGESGGVAREAAAPAGNCTGMERKATSSASPAPSEGTQSSMKVFFTLTGAVDVVNELATAGTPALKR